MRVELVTLTLSLCSKQFETRIEETACSDYKDICVTSTLLKKHVRLGSQISMLSTKAIQQQKYWVGKKVLAVFFLLKDSSGELSF